MDLTEGSVMKVISFVNMKGGVGKTTLAVNVADALNRRADKRVLLVDIDPQFNATQCLFSGEAYVATRQKGGHTIINIYDDTGQARVSPIKGILPSSQLNLEDVKPWSVRPGLDIIPGDLELYRLDGSSGQGREQRLKRFLKKSNAAATYDYVIIDTPPTPSSWMMSALLASDYYVIPVKAEPLSRIGIDLLRGVVGRCTENFGHDIECLGVILTLTDRRTTNYADTVAWLDANGLWKDRRFSASLPQRTAVARDQGRQSLILDSSAADTKSALSQIMNELLKRLDDE
jgi:chromosome partitioning protein